MQVIIGLLGSILTILYMLDRLGIDLGELSAKQSEYIASIRSLYAPQEKTQGTWS